MTDPADPEYDDIQHHVALLRWQQGRLREDATELSDEAMEWGGSEQPNEVRD